MRRLTFGNAHVTNVTNAPFFESRAEVHQIGKLEQARLEQKRNEFHANLCSGKSSFIPKAT